MHCDFFKWHEEWVNKRMMMVLNELKKVNANLEMMHNNNANRRDEDITDNELSLMKGKLVLTELEKKKLKRSKDLYKMGLCVVVIFMVVYVFM